METMRDLRARMKSIGQSLQMTKAMKLISTAKLRKARRQLSDAIPYFDSIKNAMADIAVNSNIAASTWFDRRERKPDKKIATIIISSDRGLAGGFNINAIRLAEEKCPEGSIVMTIGSVCKRYFMDKNYILLEDFASSRKVPTVYEARDIANFIMDQYSNERIDEFRVIYTRMISTVKLVPELFQLLPLEKKLFEKNDLIGRRYNCEPDEESAFAAMVPHYLKGVIYGCLVETFASEQAARMTAMDSAVKNAGDMLARIKLKYNRARQQAITQEVSEIVAGAAALT